MLNNMKKWWDSITFKESQQSQTSAQGTENNNGSLTIERDIIKGTPFTIVGTPKDGYWLTMGKHRLSKIYKTKKEVLNYVKKADWTLLTSVIIAFVYDRELVDKAYTKNTGIPPDEKANRVAQQEMFH